MKFYHCFFTDLPDEFVEANSERLIKWTDGWHDKNRYYRRAMLIDGVPIDFTGNAKVNNWPTLKGNSDTMLANWMAKKGQNYNGGYWGTLTEDQRDPDRVARNSRRDNPISAGIAAYGTGPGLTARDLARAYGSGLMPSAVLHQMMRDMMVEKPKPPLKRDGIIAGEIIGYRCWRIERGLLRSVYQADTWEPGQVLEGRELGDWDSRGIHAWKDSGSKHYHDYIRSYLNRENDPFTRYLTWSDNEKTETRPAMVTGTVFLWGDVVEHQRGYRAEYARVRSLDWLYPDAGMMGREEESLNRLRAKYGVLR